MTPLSAKQISLYSPFKVQVQNSLKPHLKYKIFNFLVSNNSGVREDVIVAVGVYVGFVVI